MGKLSGSNSAVGFGLVEKLTTLLLMCLCIDSFSFSMLPAPCLLDVVTSLKDCSFVELIIGLSCCWLILSVRGSTSATPPQLAATAG